MEGRRQAAAKHWCWAEGKALKDQTVCQLPVSPGSDPGPRSPDKLGLATCP